MVQRYGSDAAMMSPLAWLHYYNHNHGFANNVSILIKHSITGVNVDPRHAFSSTSDSYHFLSIDWSIPWEQVCCTDSQIPYYGTDEECRIAISSVRTSLMVSYAVAKRIWSPLGVDERFQSMYS